MDTQSTQFSIYKIDYEAVEACRDIKNDRESPGYYAEIVDAVIKHIESSLLKKDVKEKHYFNYKDFSGIFFKTSHEVSWEGIAKQLLSNNELTKAPVSDNFFRNTNVSYILLCCDEKNVYACTGGFGNFYISQLVMKNYGLYLLPKLIDKNNPVIRSITSNDLLGNQASSNVVNRNTTSISSEQAMSSIFRQLIVEADRGMAQQLGVIFDEDEPEKKKISLINKDSLVIRRSFSLNQLRNILRNLSNLEKKEDAFPLNYMVLAKKKKMKSSDLYDKMVDDFFAGEFSRFILAGDDYAEYYLNASSYRLYDENNVLLKTQKEPMTFNDVVVRLKQQGKMSKGNIRIMLKYWTISALDECNNTVLYPMPIYDALQGFIEYGFENMPCFLFNKNWYVFDKQYDFMLNCEYNNFYDNNFSEADRIVKKWKLRDVVADEKCSEDEYNKKLKENADITITHTVLVDNVELADAIFFEDDTVFFLHNKMHFGSTGVRDLSNQILIASDLLQKKSQLSASRSFFEDYYDLIQCKYHDSSLLNKNEFVKKMIGAKKYVYVAGYINGFKKNTKSTYAKYLCVDLKKKLIAKGMDFYVVSLT